MLKVELHAHTADDRADRVAHTTRDLVEHAMGLGYHALAITLHDIQRDNARDAAWARERGFVLIGGIERTIEGVHILLINFPAHATAQVRRFEDISRAEGGAPARPCCRAARVLPGRQRDGRPPRHRTPRGWMPSRSVRCTRAT